MTKNSLSPRQKTLTENVCGSFGECQNSKCLVVEKMHSECLYNPQICGHHHHISCHDHQACCNDNHKPCHNCCEHPHDHHIRCNNCHTLCHDFQILCHNRDLSGTVTAVTPASADRSGWRGPATKAAGGVGPHAPAGHPAQCLPTRLPFDDALRLGLVWQAA